MVALTGSVMLGGCSLAFKKKIVKQMGHHARPRRASATAPLHTAYPALALRADARLLFLAPCNMGLAATLLQGASSV